MESHGPRAGLPCTRTAPADAGRSALVYPGLPENVCAPGRAGALVRDGAEQSQSMDAHPLAGTAGRTPCPRSEEHTSELQSQSNLVCRLLLEKKKKSR